MKTKRSLFSPPETSVPGELPAETDTEALASFLLAMTRGLAALHRGYDDTAVAEQAARAISQVLKAPPLKN